MAIILNIDTAVDTASVCLAEEAHSLQFAVNHDQKGHASWLHPAIQKITTDAGMKMGDLEAVAVTIGPGSYTGLRVGLSAAKGLCFALDLPLITIHTLEMMAYSNKDYEADLLCPLIDARRMEVFMGVYDKLFKKIVEPKAMIINPNSFDSLLSDYKIVFSGNGSEKVKTVVHHKNAVFSGTVATAADMAYLSAKQFSQKSFAGLAYTEPLYMKEFYSPAH
jgi:tRNA threonylcarbamoyladenosine biosynthesis protein TsaB